MFLSVKDADKPRPVEVARDLSATRLPAGGDQGHGGRDRGGRHPGRRVNKVLEGRPHIVDMIKNHEIALVINTVEEKRSAIADSRSIRMSAQANKVTYLHDHVGRARGRRGPAFILPRIWKSMILQGLHARLN